MPRGLVETSDFDDDDVDGLGRRHKDHRVISRDK